MIFNESIDLINHGFKLVRIFNGLSKAGWFGGYREKGDEVEWRQGFYA